MSKLYTIIKKKNSEQNAHHAGGIQMIKHEMQFAVVTKGGVVVQVGKSQIYQPKIDFKGGEVKWFDDTKLIKKRAQNERTD